MCWFSLRCIACYVFILPPFPSPIPLSVLASSLEVFAKAVVAAGIHAGISAGAPPGFLARFGGMYSLKKHRIVALWFYLLLEAKHRSKKLQIWRCKRSQELGFRGSFNPQTYKVTAQLQRRLWDPRQLPAAKAQGQRSNHHNHCECPLSATCKASSLAEGLWLKLGDPGVVNTTGYIFRRSWRADGLSLCFSCRSPRPKFHNLLQRYFQYIFCYDFCF